MFSFYALRRSTLAIFQTRVSELLGPKFYLFQLVLQVLPYLNQSDGLWSKLTQMIGQSSNPYRYNIEFDSTSSETVFEDRPSPSVVWFVEYAFRGQRTLIRITNESVELLKSRLFLISSPLYNSDRKVAWAVCGCLIFVFELRWLRGSVKDTCKIDNHSR